MQVLKNNKILLFSITAITMAILMLYSSLAHAQSIGTQESEIGLEDNLEELIIAKDQKEETTLERIKTFENVIDLSISEAKDIRVNLLSSDDIRRLADEDSSLEGWKNEMLTSLNSVIEHLEEQRNSIENREDEISLEEIKSIATEFKEWRNNQFLPIKNQIKDLTLILKENNIISVANDRWSKVEEDLNILNEAGIVDESSPLWDKLEEARVSIEEGEVNNQKAIDLFFDIHVLNNSESKEDIEIDTIEQNIEEEEVNDNDNVSASSSINTLTTDQPKMSATTSTSTQLQQIDKEDEDQELINEQPDITEQQPTVRGLVSSSLNNIREAYGSFIEMSDFVRELLI